MSGTYKLKMELDVAREPKKLLADKAFTSLDEVTALVSEFLQLFGEADHGPQVIRITLETP
jgi:hypothetical protein